MSADFDTAEFADNPEPRCPCVLLLDTSGSMEGDSINALNAGLVTFREELGKDEQALLRVWEYAARAGTQTPLWWGRDIGTGHANCAGCGSRWDNHETAPAGSFPANPFGLHDTVGNVWEWVADCWHDRYQGAPTDGSAWLENCAESRRVLRGGSWNEQPRNARVADRTWYDTHYRSDLNGFRLAQDLNP